MIETPVIIVTGASSGFGRATARLFARKGYHVVLAARRIERLSELAESIHQDGGKALVQQSDVSKLEDIQNLASTTIQNLGRIDVLFNNAGFGRLNWLEKLDPIKDVKAQIEVDLIGLIWMAQAVLPYMIEARKGHIINMASMASFVATPTYTIYAACKHAVRGFSEALRREVSIYGIRVSTLYPGGAKTEFGEIAGIKRTTNIRTPKFLALNVDKVAEAVWWLTRHPKRNLVMPWVMNFAAWGNFFFPRIYDWAIEQLFVKPERKMG